MESAASSHRWHWATSVLLFLALALSFALNLYFLFLQPLGVISTRRLGLAAGVGAALSVVAWTLGHKYGYSFHALWQKLVIQNGMWRAGLLLSALLYIIYPAPPNYLFALPTALQVEFQPLSSEPATVTLISLNNGMVDVSYQNIAIDQEVSLQEGTGILFSVSEGTPARLGWQGRAWQRMTLILTADQPLQLVVLNGQKEEKLTIEAGQEKKLVLPVSGWWYYPLVKIGVILIGALSLALLVGALRLTPLWEAE
jgi:hypothetical protein